MQRKIISLTVFFSFVLLCATSIVLYIAPEGRVAYWGNWELLLFSKTQWGALHIVGGLLFLLASIWHLILNWKLIVVYIKKGTGDAFRKPLPTLIALGICLITYGGTLLGMPPMKQIMDWNADIKVWQAAINGKPPYGHAELSTLEKFCSFMELNLDSAIARLQQAKIKGPITPQTTILELAKANDCTPQQIFLLIKETGEGKGQKRGVGQSE